MRKITQQSIHAFNGSYNFNKANMRVEVSPFDQSTRLYLHGNLIAYRDPRGLVYITHAGWRSNTTKERLNGLDGVRINQKDFTWYLNGHEWTNPGDLTCINTWPNPNPAPNDYSLKDFTLN